MQPAPDLQKTRQEAEKLLSELEDWRLFSQYHTWAHLVATFSDMT